MSNQGLCPLCDQETDYFRFDQGRTANVMCKRCGQFGISWEASDALSLTSQYKDQRYLLSATCRLWSESSPPRILTNNLQSLIQKAPRLTVVEQLDELLTLMAKSSPQLGSPATFDAASDYPLLVARGPGEIAYLIQALEENGDVKRVGEAHVLTVNGWDRIERIRQAGRGSRLAFVAMWFDDVTNELYRAGIEPAIRKAGYEPLRIDRHEHVNRIDDEIIGQIRRSRFMVADFTGQRHGVYFEAGLMIGLGRNVIWLCDKKEIEEGKVHFDVRQYNFIDWESPEDAGKRLLNRVLAIEGEGPGVGTSGGKA
jgi:hypothetical protein